MKIVCGGQALTIPDCLEQMDTYPDDPPGSVSYGMQTDKTANFMLIYPIACDKAMPFHTSTIIVDSIHKSLADNQGSRKDGIWKTLCLQYCEIRKRAIWRPIHPCTSDRKLRPGAQYPVIL